jgi:hypothetical protein
VFFVSRYVQLNNKIDPISLINTYLLLSVLIFGLAFSVMYKTIIPGSVKIFAGTKRFNGQIKLGNTVIE